MWRPRDFRMKEYKFISSSKVESMIKTILSNSRFSSFQEYVEWRIQEDKAKIVKRQNLI
jgi:hypothetical protein